jgi:uncharacterized phiE125 gp8 family phage protein
MADLCSLQDVKRYMPVNSNGDDTLLSSLITAASAWVENYINRSLLSASYSEEAIGRGENGFVFRNYPVTAVSSLMVDGVTVPQAINPTDSGWRLVNSYMLRLNGWRFTPGSVVQISYTAGYASITALPAEVSQAVIEIVALRYKERSWIGHKSKGLHADQVAYTNADVPDDVKKTLNQYTRVVPL